MKPPTFDCAQIHPEIPAESNVDGFRDIGEGGAIGAPAAVANAIADALGVEIEALPATPERLFRPIGQQQRAMGA